MDRYIEKTKDWLEHWVIALNLCPFAAVPFRKEQIRYIVSETADPEQLMKSFLEELQLLSEVAASEVATTLLIHPNTLLSFEHYLDFVAEGETLIHQAGLDGIFQVATFHPEYQFAGVPYDDSANYTNRSPFPMLHLLREESITKALMHYPNPEQIPAHNVALLRKMGIGKIKQLLMGLHKR